MQLTYRKYYQTGLLLFCAWLAACSDGSGDGSGNDLSPQLAWPIEGWETSSPEAQGMNADKIAEALDYAFQAQKHTQGVVIVRHGVIVAEMYSEDRDADSYATSWSAAKSFTSALIGIAIAEGLIEHVDVSLAEYFPEWRGTDKEAITLRHALQMASGLDWDESYNPAGGISNSIQMIVLEYDHLAYMLSIPVAHPPAVNFNYSSGETMLLSGVLEAATGQTAGDYARDKLFAPLGMGPVDWWLDASGRTTTYCCIDTPTRQFAKFGLLYARGGRWGDQQIVPEQWVIDSTTPSDAAAFYGYQWWLGAPIEASIDVPGGVYAARGFDGQYIYVMPGLDLVVVRNGLYDKYDGEPQADPSLYAFLPNGGRVAGLGSVGPDNWDDAAFLQPIVDSLK